MSFVLPFTLEPDHLLKYLDNTTKGFLGTVLLVATIYNIWTRLKRIKKIFEDNVKTDEPLPKALTEKLAQPTQDHLRMLELYRKRCVANFRSHKVKIQNLDNRVKAIESDHSQIREDISHIRHDMSAARHDMSSASQTSTDILKKMAGMLGLKD